MEADRGVAHLSAESRRLGRTINLNAGFFVVAKAGQERACPICRNLYTSSFDRGQCTRKECNFVFAPFKDAQEATRVAAVPVEKGEPWGNCPRCLLVRRFSRVIEQCSRCGQLMEVEAGPSRKSLDDNRAVVERLLKEVSV